MKRLICLTLMAAMLLTAAMAAAETAPSLSFADLTDLDWRFSSGVGAWYTFMWLEEDGTFTGEFHDSEMGETGEGYPDGTVYGCLFHGKMTLVGQVDEYSWKIHVDALDLDEGQAPEVIEDGMRFVTCDPYGLKAGNDMLLYLPGTPVEKLPEDFVFWAHLYSFGEDMKELPYYGLYDPQEETGFIGEQPYGRGEVIVGAWRKEGEEAAESYSLLILKNDGTGELLQLPEQTGVPLAWYAESEGWTVCFASPDVTVKMTYNEETDRLTVTEGDQATVYCRDWWTESELFFSESL
ncbi:MAG: hypothetical protein IK099_15045 [Clostridia bacterium]|nr:hypothetical protein [Clostridia bacterium]